MPDNPTVNAVHIDVPLTNISVAHMQSLDGFIANRVFPVIPVNKKSDKWYVYDRGDWNRDEMKPRAPSTQSTGSGWRLSNDAYYCERYALHRDIDDEMLANADSLFQLETESAEWLGLKGLIHREVKFQSKYFKTGVWTTDIDVQASADFGSAAFSSASSTPIKGIRAAKRSQQLLTGIRPNRLAIAAKTWDLLVDNEDFLSRIIGGATPGQPAQVNRALLAALLEVESVEIADGLVNAAKEGVAESNQFVLNEGMLLYYAPSRPGLRTASAGYTFAWKGLQSSFLDGVATRSFRMESITSQRVEIEDNFDQKIVSVDCGTFIHNTI